MKMSVFRNFVPLLFPTSVEMREWWVVCVCGDAQATLVAKVNEKNTFGTNKANIGDPNHHHQHGGGARVVLFCHKMLCAQNTTTRARGTYPVSVVHPIV
jgi:hypothetical protein